MHNRHEKQALENKQLLERARAGMCSSGFNVVIPAPEVLEIGCQFGFEWVSIDQEHTLIQGARQTANMLRAVEPYDLPVLVKPNALDPLLVRDALDAGAHGVLLPFVNSAEHLRAIEEQIRYAPLGKRGFCAIGRSMNYFAEAGGAKSVLSSHVEFINEHAIFVPLIETVEAAENIDEILAVPGFEVFHVGIGDLMFSVRQEGEDFEYAYRLADMLCKKIHDAGKLVMHNIELREPLTDSTALIERYHVHMPYLTDTVLLAYACGQSMKVRDNSQGPLKKLLESVSSNAKS